MNYNPDYRQVIVDNWSRSSDDSYAKMDWGWEPQFSLKQICGHVASPVGRLPCINIVCFMAVPTGYFSFLLSKRKVEIKKQLIIEQ
jgi:hypothetical protein